MVKDSPTESDYDSDSTLSGDEDDPPILDLSSRSFSDISSYIESLAYPKTRLLGTLDEKNVLVSLTGHIPPSPYGHAEFVRGRCLISVDNVRIPGYCIGVIAGTGTGIIVSKKGKMYVYTPCGARDPGWEVVEDHCAAEVIVDDSLEIWLRFLPDFHLDCVD